MTQLLNPCLLLLMVMLLMSTNVSAVVKRCWTCRSRGEYGDCRDPFLVTSTNVQDYPGVSAAPCASGWCGKIVEGDEVGKKVSVMSNHQPKNPLKYFPTTILASQYSIATERLCLQRPPDDNQERCAETNYKHRKVYMCFCMGDLCNSGIITKSSIAYLLVGIAAQWLFRKL